MAFHLSPTDKKIVHRQHLYCAMTQAQDILSRLEKCVSRLEKIDFSSSSGGGKSSGNAGSSAPQVVAYDDYYSSHVVPLLETCKKIGGDLASAVGVVFCCVNVLKLVSILSDIYSSCFRISV